MKRIITALFLLFLLFVSLLPITAFADIEGNVDGGGGGMESGTSDNYWNTGDEAVRVTVVRASDHAVVTAPIDLTNKKPSGTIGHFHKISKIQYNNGTMLSPTIDSYVYVNPSKSIPKIISTTGGNVNIPAIKSYFTDELVIKYIATVTGMDYDVLIRGDYKLLLEPVAYLTFNGVKLAMTATEAALYDEQIGGGLREKMGNLSHKNLPLAMFLEVGDLGYPAWSGSKTSTESNADIKAALGLGIVRFKDKPEAPPEIGVYDYEYRVGTEVITSVFVSGGQSDPDRPVSVSFQIGGKSYIVGNVFYPDGDSQLAWVRWTTPDAPQTMTIEVSVTGGGTASKGTITANIVDLSGNDPPNPVADDRNDSFSSASAPVKPQTASASWGVWRPWWRENWVWISNWKWVGSEEHGHWEDRGHWEDHGWWMFDFDRYRTDISASMTVTPDEKNPTASGKVMKSGYGINQSVTASVSTNQSTAVTPPQNAVTCFPEFRYESYWRLLDRTASGYSARFEFAKNQYSTYNRRTHFTPLWMPDGTYKPHTWMIDCWTPAGMLSMSLTDAVTIKGNLWQDWHIAPQKPD